MRCRQIALKGQKQTQGLGFCPFRATSYVPKTYGVAVGYLLLAFQAVYQVHFFYDMQNKNYTFYEF